MKKVIIFTFLIISSLQIINAQEKDEFKLITSGTWHLEYIEMEGQKMNLPTEMQKNNWVIFHANGKQEGMEEGRKYEGKWEYDTSTKTILTNDLDGKVEQKLIMVDKNKLVVSVMDQGSKMIMGMTNKAK
jgi:hypothetical protein